MQGTKESIETVTNPTPAEALRYYNALKVLQTCFPYSTDVYDEEIENTINSIENLRQYFLCKIVDKKLIL